MLTSDSNVTIPPDFFPVIPVTCLSSDGTPGLWITEQDNSVVFLSEPHELLLFDLKTDIEVKCSSADGTSNITARISLGRRLISVVPKFIAVIANSNSVVVMLK